MNINSVLTKISIGERTFINNHNDEEGKLEGYVILEPICDERCICPVFIGTTFCLNYLYVSPTDGKIHLSTYSVGGIMNGVYKNFDKEVEKYNNSTPGRKIINYEIFKK